MRRFTLHNPNDEIRQYKTRTLIIVSIILLLLLSLIARLVYLQLFQHYYYLTLSKQNLLSISPIDPSRGLIYDRNGVLLATNIPVFSLEVIPDKAKHLQASVQALSKLIPLSDSDRETFEKQVSEHRKFNPVPLKIKLSEKEIAIFSVNQYKFPGFFIRTHMVRYYPFGPLMEPVLGYVGRINAAELSKVDPANYSASNYIGKTGIEKYDETLLHGTVGLEQVETGADGEIVRSLENRPAIAGQNLYLTIDAKLQGAAHDAMQGESGAVIMLNPQNGDVLAFVSTPSFDPNPFVTGISSTAYKALRDDPARPLFNRLLQGEYSPGSTIKLFYGLGYLENNLISFSSSVYCPGHFQLPNSKHVYHCWDRKGHGEMDLENAIIQSCDVFFYTLAEKAGIHRMDTILQSFGFGAPTGIDTDTERSGLVPSPEWKKRVHHQPWYGGDAVVMGIGQGYLLVTPLQLSTALMQLVDHGHGFRPHLLLKTESPQGISNMSPAVPFPVHNAPEADWNLILRAMHEVITDPRGTGYRAGHSAAYTFGGKSGTAQVFSLRSGEEDKAYLLPKNLRDDSWFIAFAPADHPTVVLTLFLEHGGEGKATYLARQILDKYFQYYPLKKDSSTG